MMPVTLEFLRGVLGLLCLFFAFMAGRVLVDFHKGRVRQSRLIAWTIRTMVCALAMLFPQRVVDTIAILVWVLAAGTFALGLWAGSRIKEEEDLTKTIFPNEP